MKKILLYTIACAVAVSSCKRNDPKPDETPTDPYKLEYSNLTTEQHKQKLEQSGIEFVQKINTLPDEKFVNVLDYLSQLQPGLGSDLEMEPVSTVFAINNAAKKKNISALFKAATSEGGETSKLSELFGIYTWNSEHEEWVETESTSKIEFLFPSDATKTTNNSVLTFTYVASNVTVTEEGETVELPASQSTILKVDDHVELSLISAFEYKTDGTPTKAYINLVLGAFSMKTFVNNDGVNLKSGFSLNKGTEQLMSLNTEANGNLTVENGQNSDDIVDVLKNANATFEIMNIQLVGKIDVKAISDAEKAASSLSDSLENVAVASAFNKYASFVAVNLTDNAVIAKVNFHTVSDDSHCDEDWEGVNNCESDFYLEPRLVFKDGSPISFETFFKNGFSQLIGDMEEFSDEFE